MGNFKSWIARSMRIAGAAGLTIGGMAILLGAPSLLLRRSCLGGHR